VVPVDKIEGGEFLKMSIQVNLRVSDGLRDRLIAAAEARGVSMNKEINDRLLRSFVADDLGTNDAELAGLMAVIAAAMTAAGRAAGFLSTLTPEGARTWSSNPVAFAQATVAAEHVLKAAMPSATTSHPLADDVAKIISTFGRGFANAILEEAASGTSRTRSSSAIARAKSLHASISKRQADNFKAGEPREPLLIQAGPTTEQQPFLLAELTEPQDGRKK
jgi:Flp pilus assembly pilin Flp